MQKNILRLALVDDHTLFRKGLVSLIEVGCKAYQPVIVFEANDGTDMIAQLAEHGYPNIIILDVNMPKMDGFETVLWLREHCPEIMILIVSMINEEASILKMLSYGVKGYLSKDVEPKELEEALVAIVEKGYYYTDYITGRLIHSLTKNDVAKETDILAKLNDREKEFLQLACSENTYYEIASKMYLSPKTIDGYRHSLFQKLSVKSRVGLALFAIKNKLVSFK